ncbi:DmX-like protein 2 [Cricetulus griseus]|uniref:DmX-like protein 2 n=1 Tax=Cricetulus griseus TaxID=10029 RepID=G3H0B2_CRIGR|nr:DmX-like protein 2 [Cricetulus griseus]
MHVYAQWKHSVKFGDIEADSPVEETVIQDHSTFKSTMLPRISIVEGATITDDVFGSPTVVQDGGLFEAAHALSPTLPQYHPTQLLELMDLGKVRRAKAILSHLVKCIAGEVAIVRDPDAGEGTKRHLSRTISVSGSTAKDTVTIGKDGARDYTEIDSIPPLPLHALLAADQDTSYRISEESTKKPQSYEAHIESQPGDQYSELFQVQEITTDDIDLEPEKRENKSKVINLSQYGPAYFGQEHARVLSSHLMHSSLPGLTRLEQMFLVALADTVATTSTELDENRDKYSGVSTCHFAWAFHSEAEEELINMIPAIQRGDPQWSELRAMGIGWWVRNVNTLRRCIEKVAKASFQRNNDALDAALFYLSMKKKAVVWGLFSLAYWVMKDYTRALDTLLEQTPKEDDEQQVIIKSCNPVVFSFYNYLRTHPLLIRRNLASPEGTLATLGLKTEKNIADKINLIERKLFFTTANAHFKVGCPVLALEVLSKIPKVTKMSSLTAKKDPLDFTSERMENGPSKSGALNDGSGSSGAAWSAKASSQFDWSQPIVTVDEEPLQLDWGEDHDSALEEDDTGGLVMKSTDVKKDGQDHKASDHSALLTPQEEDCVLGDSEVDVIAEQLKFRACLKILMTELRTLATGYEVDGGKLRFQLYNWLEKEIAALHEICNHESVIKEYSSKTYSKVESELLDHEEMVDKPDIGSYERHQIERRRLQAKREHAERRKLWLQKNQDLLRVFLSYCSLHGAQGGGLASVRMELKFLLQESQQPFLPLSDSGVIYDSDESVHSDDEEDDAFFSDTQIQEHQDPNSYSWALLHLTMVKLALHNIKNFFPIAGLEFSELPVTSPLGIAVIKNLENWEQILQEKMDRFEGPPPNYVNTYPTDLSVEADLGYPGGKAKVIHKESDMIMAFSINKANSNEIVLASTHDVQELDVTSLLACQSYIWIGEEYDRESKSSDDIDYRGSTTTLYQPGAASHSTSQVHPPPSLPWLGSGQTSTGATVLMKRNLHNVKRMTSHPVHQYYLTGAQDGSVRMFEWTRPQQLVCFRQAGNARVTRLYFNSQGNKVWRLTGHGLIHSFKNEHAKQSIFRNIGAGVMQIDISQDNRLFSCGADGTLKTRVLPSAFNIPNRILDIL